MATDENPHAYCTWCGSAPNRHLGEVECRSRAQALDCAWLTGVDHLLAEEPRAADPTPGRAADLPPSGSSMAEKTPLQKVHDARNAVAEAAALLLGHAEGLAMLRRIVLTPDPAPAPAVTPGRPYLIPNREAETAYRRAVVAAALFVGEHAASDQVVAPRAAALRRAVEEFVGPRRGVLPPHASSLPEDIEARYGAEPGSVVAQAWRDHLAALAADSRPQLVRVR